MQLTIIVIVTDYNLKGFFPFFSLSFSSTCNDVSFTDVVYGMTNVLGGAEPF